MYAITDAHCHIFPDKIAAKAVENIGEFYSLQMQNKGTSVDLIGNEKAGICKFIVCSSATSRSQVKNINRFLLEETTKHENFRALISLHPDMEANEIDEELEFAKSNGFRGIKLHPDFQKFAIDDERAFKIYERAEGRFPILFHTGDKRYAFSNPQRLIKVAKKFKNLVCIGAHFGGYSEWEEAENYLQTPNVFFDTSSALKFLPGERAVELIRLLGSERFMFGTDYPMWNAFEELERFFDLQLSVEENKAILSDNADRIYGF